MTLAFKTSRIVVKLLKLILLLVLVRCFGPQIAQCMLASLALIVEQIRVGLDEMRRLVCVLWDWWCGPR